MKHMFNCMCVDRTQGTAPVHAEFLQFSSLDFFGLFHSRQTTRLQAWIVKKIFMGFVAMIGAK